MLELGVITVLGTGLPLRSMNLGEGRGDHRSRLQCHPRRRPATGDFAYTEEFVMAANITRLAKRVVSSSHATSSRNDHTPPRSARIAVDAGQSIVPAAETTTP